MTVGWSMLVAGSRCRFGKRLSNMDWVWLGNLLPWLLTRHDHFCTWTNPSGDVKGAASRCMVHGEGSSRPHISIVMNSLYSMLLPPLEFGIRV
jgi:hypothetical protein